MAPFDLSSQLIELAVLRKLLDPMDLETVRALPEAVSPALQVSVLVRMGKLKEADVQSLTLELVQAPPSMFSDEPPETEEAPDPSQIPLTWKGYTQLQPIGMGGGGVVYKAWDVHLNRWVALKFLRRKNIPNSTQLLREARAQASIDHPNIIKVYEVGEHKGQPYIAMQLVEGGTLREVSPRLDLNQRIQLVIRLAEGLQEAHQAGLIHLDIKPANVLVDFTDKGEPWPYLTDFGIVLRGEQPFDSEICGTPFFASPEQLGLTSTRVDARSDIFSLGATLYFLLAGVPPFDTFDLATNSTGPLVPLRKRDAKLPLDLEAITTKCLDPDPAERYPTARRLATELKRFLAHRPVEARGDSIRYRASMFLKRNRILVIVSSLIFLLLTSAGAWRVQIGRRAARRARLEEQFWQHVQGMDQMLRVDHLSRPHDRRFSVEAVRRTMDQIRQDMKVIGADAVGPGLFALGEGYRLLNMLPEARQCLDQAWNGGFRTPDCAQSRGLVLAAQYQNAKIQLNPHAGDEGRRSFLDLQTNYRNPAIECFNLARKAAHNVYYQEAWEAYLNGDLRRAISRTIDNGQSAPWMYELELMRYNIQIELANELRSKGDIREASKELENARMTIEHACEMAPSDPATWSYRSEWCFLMSDLPGTPMPRRIELVQEARRSLEMILLVDPDHYRGYMGMAQYWRKMARIAASRGEDVLPHFDKNVAFATQAAQKNESPVVTVALCWAVLSREKERMDRGQDSRAELDKVIARLRKILNQDSSFDSLDCLEFALELRGRAAIGRSEDPAPYYRESIHWCDETIRVENTYQPLYVLTGLLRRIELADAEMDLGRAPTESMEYVVQQLDALAHTHKDEPDILVELAAALRVQARQQEMESKPAGMVYAASFNAARQANALSPGSIDVIEALARSAHAYSRWKLRNFQDPNPVLAIGISAAQKWRSMNPYSDIPKALESALKLLRWKAISHFDGMTQEANTLRFLCLKDPLIRGQFEKLLNEAKPLASAPGSRPSQKN